MARTGHTPDVIREQWDLPMVFAINEYWREIPPVDLLVARYLEYTPAAVDNSEPGADQKLMRDYAEQGAASSLLPPSLREAAARFLEKLH